MPHERPRVKPVFQFLWRAVRALLLTLAAIVLAIEEWGWRPLTAWAARLARWAPIARLEARLRAAPPRVALALFLVPAVLLFPIKVLAVWLIHLGRTTLGLAVIVLAKVLGTALVGRLFVLTEPQLTRFAWFARALAWWRATKRRVHEAVVRAPWWQALKRGQRRWTLWLRRRVRGAR